MNLRGGVALSRADAKRADAAEPGEEVLSRTADGAVLTTLTSNVCTSGRKDRSVHKYTEA